LADGYVSSEQLCGPFSRLLRGRRGPYISVLEVACSRSYVGVLVWQIDHSQCITSDYPRLKGR
jgi:hypothetical protein